MVIGGSGLTLSTVSNLVGKEAVAEPLKALYGKEPAIEVSGGISARSTEELSANRAVTAPLEGGLSGRIEERVGLDKVALAVLVATVPKKIGGEEVEEKRVEAQPVASPYTYKLLLESMTGRKLKVVDLDRADSEDVDVKTAGSGTVKEEEEAANAGGRVEYNFKEVTLLREFLLFKAGGTVRTSDGALRGFTVKLRLSRSQYSETTLGFTAVDGKPVGAGPVATSFTASSLSATAEKRLFDLNTDFDSKSVRPKSADAPAILTAPGSEVLVYGKNANGASNTGGEDYSLSNGNGSELAPYGSGQEVWIDENDPVYKSLRVIVEGPNGEDTLVSLKEVGIGAISFKYTDTALSIKDSVNNIDTAVKRTGLFLNAKYGSVTEPQGAFRTGNFSRVGWVSEA